MASLSLFAFMRFFGVDLGIFPQSAVMLSAASAVSGGAEGQLL